MSDPVVQHQPLLRKFLATRFARLAESDRDDILQNISLRVLTMLRDDPSFQPDSDWSTYLCGAAVHEALACLRRLERGWFQSLSEDLGEPPPASEIAEEATRRDRQSQLLSDILREFTSACEGRPGGHIQREVYERRMRGQPTSDIATAIALTEDNVYQHLSRARKWVRDRIEQADVERTVFQTFLCERRDVLARKHLPEGTPSNFAEVLRIVIEEAGAMCPSRERLGHFRAGPRSPEFHDIYYHVVEAQCCLCQS